MEDLIKLLLEPLITDIKKIKIEKNADGSSVAFLVSVPQEDIAKVIGKEGKMIKTIKNLLKIRASKEQTFVTLDVQEQ